MLLGLKMLFTNGKSGYLIAILLLIFILLLLIPYFYFRLYKKETIVGAIDKISAHANNCATYCLESVYFHIIITICVSIIMTAFNISDLKHFSLFGIYFSTDNFFQLFGLITVYICNLIHYINYYTKRRTTADNTDVIKFVIYGLVLGIFFGLISFVNCNILIVSKIRINEVIIYSLTMFVLSGILHKEDNYDVAR